MSINKVRETVAYRLYVTGWRLFFLGFATMLACGWVFGRVLDIKILGIITVMAGFASAMAGAILNIAGEIGLYHRHRWFKPAGFMAMVMRDAVLGIKGKA